MTRTPCTKHGYRDKIAALFALAELQTKDDPRRPKTERRVYHCGLCKHWHLTSKGRRQR